MLMLNFEIIQIFIGELVTEDFYQIIAFLFAFIIVVGILAAFVKILNNRSS
jgi:hypothetical protein